jgi:hypothetical protein
MARPASLMVSHSSDGSIRPEMPVSCANHATLGVSKRLTRFREQWDRMVEDCMRDGQVVRDGRRVGSLDAQVPAEHLQSPLVHVELGLAAVAQQPDQGAETRTEAAFSCNLNPYHPAFTAVWDAALAGTLGAFEGGTGSGAC